MRAVAHGGRRVTGSAGNFDAGAGWRGGIRGTRDAAGDDRCRGRHAQHIGSLAFSPLNQINKKPQPAPGRANALGSAPRRGEFDPSIPPQDQPRRNQTNSSCRLHERYWTQAANGLPDTERNRRAGVEYRRYLDAWWSKKPAFVNFGARAKDETGRLMGRTVHFGRR
jgi:hypothetical protein